MITIISTSWYNQFLFSDEDGVRHTVKEGNFLNIYTKNGSFYNGRVRNIGSNGFDLTESDGSKIRFMLYKDIKRIWNIH